MHKDLEFLLNGTDNNENKILFLDIDGAIQEYLSNHKVSRYAVIDDDNFYSTFGEKFRHTRNLINMDDFYYLKIILNSDINFNEEENYIFFRLIYFKIYYRFC